MTEASTVDDLAAFVVAQTGLDRESLSLRYGYPPKRIDLSPEVGMKTLVMLNISSGESITADGKMLHDDAASRRQQPQGPATPTYCPSTTTKQPQLIRKIAPSDNCCLFTSVNFCVTNPDSSRPIDANVITDTDGVQETRMLIASVVLSDPVNFNEGILGMPAENYADGIIQPERWGGGIEVSVLTSLHKIEIDVVDVLTGRIDRFGEDQSYTERILLLYDGIHYDPLAMWHPDSGTLQTIFPISQISVLAEAQALADEARRACQYTDLSNFVLMCSICRAPLRGQAGAQEHAKSTGHTQFQERSAF